MLAQTGWEERTVFADEPCACIHELDSPIQPGQLPAHFVCCYASHPLTEKINAALYMLKQLNLAGTQPVSFSDAGWLSPLIALHWADAVQQAACVVCMEQLTPYRDRQLAASGAYPLAEALALACITPDIGDWRICGYAIEQQSAEESSRGPDALVQKAVQLAKEMLSAGRASAAHTIVVPQMVDEPFVSGMRHAFPKTFLKRQAVNQGTADLWYALAELQLAKTGKSEILLVYADRKHGTGCMLLRKENAR
ncbi:hypothetical protein DUZ99_17345 [Xylanibacillus composti]|nr:hypothetical protein [Xylanibacillus composti]